MNSTLIQKVSEENFDSVTFENNITTIAFFNANRCNICTLLSSILEEVAVEYRKKVEIYSINVDEYEGLVKRFRLTGIPTLLIFKNGEVQERLTGFNNKKVIKERLDYILSLKSEEK